MRWQPSYAALLSLHACVAHDLIHIAICSTSSEHQWIPHKYGQYDPDPHWFATVCITRPEIQMPTCVWGPHWCVAL